MFINLMSNDDLVKELQKLTISDDSEEKVKLLVLTGIEVLKIESKIDDLGTLVDKELNDSLRYISQLTECMSQLVDRMDKVVSLVDSKLERLVK